MIATDAALYPPISGDISPHARAAALTRGGRVAAWLHQCETDVLWASPSAPDELEARLQTALVAACTGDWSQLELEAPDPTRVSGWRRLGPRVALTVALLGAAFLLPIAFAGSLSSTAQDTMRVSLIIASVTALVTPAQALSDATIDSIDDKRLLEVAGASWRSAARGEQKVAREVARQAAEAPVVKTWRLVFMTPPWDACRRPRNYLVARLSEHRGKQV